MKFQSLQNGSNFMCEEGTFLQIRSHIVHSFVARTLYYTAYYNEPLAYSMRHNKSALVNQ